MGGSRYLEQIERFLPHFPLEHMFFMVLEEDFAASRAATVARVLDFLGVGPDPRINLDVRDSSNSAPQVLISTLEHPVHHMGESGKRALAPGTIVFRTGNRWADAVVFGPSSAAQDHFGRLAQNPTIALDEEVARRIYREEFKDGIGRLETLLGRDLSCWRRD